MTKWDKHKSQFFIQKTDKNDRINIYLPGEFRNNQSPSKYVIYLPESISKEQKMEVENMIKKCLRIQ